MKNWKGLRNRCKVIDHHEPFWYNTHMTNENNTNKNVPSEVLDLVRYMGELLDEVADNNGFDFQHFAWDAIYRANKLLAEHSHRPIKRQEA